MAPIRQGRRSVNSEDESGAPHNTTPGIGSQQHLPSEDDGLSHHYEELYFLLDVHAQEMQECTDRLKTEFKHVGVEMKRSLQQVATGEGSSQGPATRVQPQLFTCLNTKILPATMDTDVLWLRDLFPRLNLNDGIVLQISVDEFNGNQWSERDQLINTGFYMIKSNNKTITLFDEWYSRKDSSTGMKEQDVLLELMRKGGFRRLGLGVRFLDTVFFSGICEDSRDVRAVVTVHANCCRSIKAKVQDLKRIMHDWQRFKDSPIDQTWQFAWSNHSACLESWKQ
ncbi:hypothetical protein L1987_15604 [Smallanthus sonchifolius]|uniref:Uncharacterized protein n=1 Tax=Smallanthus sonchifolius TaxID=185202 RepID=A0ACB9J854_9ASTR|nr:hypothetical protein L1987_15604 [Smallanthus sonchifolius]